MEFGVGIFFTDYSISPAELAVALEERDLRSLAARERKVGAIGAPHHSRHLSTPIVRKIADLTKPGRPQPPWAANMAKRRRKPLVVCADCHSSIHGRQPTTATTQ